MEQIKIAALGDSLTKGVVLNEENRYSILKQGFINIIGEKLDLCIRNYAKFGCTIGFGHTVIDRHPDDISAADYTLLEFGGNDCDFDWRNIAEEPDLDHNPKTILEGTIQKAYRKGTRTRFASCDNLLATDRFRKLLLFFQPVHER